MHPLYFDAPPYTTAMKIKCPACSKVLNIPESAAGKVVKCPCGKQLRAPGGTAGSPAAPKPAGGAAPRPAPKQSAAPKQPGGPKRPAAPSAVALGGLDADMFDELTDQDLKPVKSVVNPGRTATAQPRSSGEAALKRAVSGADRRGEALIHGGLAPRPGLLTFLGIVNGFWAALYFGIAMLMLGLATLLPALAQEVPEAGIGMAIILVASVVMGILCIATALACFIRGRVQWYILVVSYSYGFADRIFGIVGDAMSGDLGGEMIQGVIGILVGAYFWLFMHGDEVRAFHGTDAEPKQKIITFNVIGFVLGCLISAAVVFVATGGAGDPAFDEEAFPEEGFPEEGFPEEGFPEEGFPEEGFPEEEIPEEGPSDEAARRAPLGGLAVVLPENVNTVFDVALEASRQFNLPDFDRADHANDIVFVPRCLPQDCRAG